MPTVTEFAGLVGLSTASCGTLAMISNLTDKEEARQAIPWAVTDAPADFTKALLSAITGMELAVTKLSGKWKVSQNQPDQNRDGVGAGLKAQSNLDSDRLIEEDSPKTCTTSTEPLSTSTMWTNAVSDSKHRILVVGTGSIGERHVRCYLATRRADVSICEVHTERRKAVAANYAIESEFEDVAEALKQSWDAVLIATPAHTHIPIATLAVAAGNNLLIEKPLSTSLDGITELQKLIAEKDVVAAVSYQLRAHPATNSMKEALDSGRFGKPLQLYMTSGQSFPFYRPAYRDTYFADRRTGGGAIQDAITHMLNLAEWLVGPMTRISVDAQHQKLDGVTVEDTVHILARHGFVMASYAMNMYQQPNDGQLTVVCEKGTVRYESDNQRWRCMTEPAGEWETFTHEFTNRDDWYIANAALLLDVIERKRPPLCSLEDALQTLKVNLAALKSADTQTWQDIV